MATKATVAQRRALVWLVANKAEPFRGGDFVDYYQERHAAAVGDPGRHSTTQRRHGWRRTGGRVLAQMERAGLTRRSGSDWGTALYRLTDEGRRIASEGAL